MKYLNIILFLLIAQLMSGQFTEGFTYQGYLINAAGSGIDNKEVLMQIELSSDRLGNDVYYSESHEVVTDENGVFSLVIGEGTPAQGAISAVNWLASVPFLTVNYDLQDGQPVRCLGTTQFQSVPFCFYAKYITCANGLAGPNGDPGFDGPVGLQGISGTNGTNGANGQDGPSGAPGLPITPILSSPPSGPEGMIYMDDGSNRLDGAPGFRYYDGSNWLDL